jgi:hypothetical protein
MTRNIDNDLENYLAIFNFFENKNFTDLYFNSEFVFGIKITEPIFYFFTYLLSKVLFNQNYLYVGLFTLVFYLNSLFGINKCLRYFGIRERQKLVYVVIFIFGCVNFSESSHLMRQYFGGSFVPLAVYFLFSDKHFKFSLLSVFIVLIHNSLIVVLAILAISKFAVFLRKKFALVGSVWASLLFFVSLNLLKLYDL